MNGLVQLATVTAVLRVHSANVVGRLGLDVFLHIRPRDGPGVGREVRQREWEESEDRGRIEVAKFGIRRHIR